MRKGWIMGFLAALLLSVCHMTFAEESSIPYTFPRDIYAPVLAQDFRKDYGASYSFTEGTSGTWRFTVKLDTIPSLTLRYPATKQVGKYKLAGLYDATISYKYDSSAPREIREYVIHDNAEVRYELKADNCVTLKEYIHNLYYTDNDNGYNINVNARYDAGSTLEYYSLTADPLKSRTGEKSHTYEIWFQGVPMNNPNNGLALNQWYMQVMDPATLMISWEAVSEVPPFEKPSPLTIGGTLNLLKGAGLKGDLDGDGTVDGKDLLLLAGKLLGAASGIDAEAADVNGDGVVDGRDLLRMARFIAGQIAELK